MASLDADSGAVRWRHELSGERVLDVTVAGEDVVNVVSVAVDSGLVLARTFRDGFFYHRTRTALSMVQDLPMRP